MACLHKGTIILNLFIHFVMSNQNYLGAEANSIYPVPPRPTNNKGNSYYRSTTILFFKRDSN